MRRPRVVPAEEHPAGLVRADAVARENLPVLVVVPHEKRVVVIQDHHAPFPAQCYVPPRRRVSRATRCRHVPNASGRRCGAPDATEARILRLGIRRRCRCEPRAAIRGAQNVSSRRMVFVLATPAAGLRQGFTSLKACGNREPTQPPRNPLSTTRPPPCTLGIGDMGDIAFRTSTHNLAKPQHVACFGLRFGFADSVGWAA